jgi:hypothetical protein
VADLLNTVVAAGCFEKFLDAFLPKTGTHRKSVPNVANKGNVSSFKHKPAAVPTKPKIAFNENSGSTSRAANTIHGPDNHEEELIVRLPSYKALII